jgi:DNA-binding FrmR family transcriptional regulator
MLQRILGTLRAIARIVHEDCEAILRQRLAITGPISRDAPVTLAARITSCLPVIRCELRPRL